MILDCARDIALRQSQVSAIQLCLIVLCRRLIRGLADYQPNRSREHPGGGSAMRRAIVHRRSEPIMT
jgi:hypothetical protein